MNDRIRVPEVRVVGPEGEQLGIMPIAQALTSATDLDYDLVEIAPTADPPVCKIMDYGKFRYEQDVKAKEARRKQQQVNVKGMRFQLKISQHDYETKRNHMKRFLGQGSKVKVSLRFKGREMQHAELGTKLLAQLSEDLKEVGAVEMSPKVDGRSMVMVLAPIKQDRKS